MTGIDGEEILDNISQGNRRSSNTSASSEAVALAGVHFKKKNTEMGVQSTSSGGKGKSMAPPPETHLTNPKHTTQEANHPNSA